MASGSRELSPETGEIEDIYPLSPMQQGLLFHTLLAPGSGVYVTQWTCELLGRPDAAALERAWQRVIDRHAALRTTFAWEGLEEPVQIVHRGMKTKLRLDDWRDAPPGEQQARLEALLGNQRRRGFDLTRAPLLDLALVRLQDRTYRFVWGFHHLILDGWSLGLVLKEVFELYDAFCRGGAVHAGPARLYRDYIAWLSRQDQARAHEFWRRELSGFQRPTALAVDRRPVESGPDDARPAAHTVRLSASLSERLRSWTRSGRVTPSTLFEGAWALLLSRYSGDRDVLFGAAVSGRPASLAGVEETVGMFINILPVRVRLPRESNLRDWLGRLQSAQVEARQHEHVSLVEIQARSDLPPGAPLFETGLVFQNYPGGGFLRGEVGAAGGLEIRDVRAIEQSHYPLTVAADLASQLTMRIQYDPGRFEEGTIRRLGSHLSTLLEAMVCEPTTRIERLPMLAPEERHRMLRDWGWGAVVDRPGAPVHRLFEARAEGAPHAIALTFEDEAVTYRELNRRANRLAHRLRALGVATEDRVALCLEGSPDLVVAMLATLKAGGAFVPLDPQQAGERLAFMLEDSGASVVLTRSALAGKLSPGGRRVLRLDVESEALSGESGADPDHLAEPGQAAYVIYTSGSTGRPKGTLIHHLGLSNLVSAVIPPLGLGPRSRVLQFASPSFDASVWEIFTALAAGGTLCMAPAESKLPGPALTQLLRDRGITTVTLPPSVLAAMEPAALPALDTVVSAGEKCPAAVVEAWGRDRRLINAYGPTESSVCASLFVCTDASSEPPIGRAIENVRLHVVDANLEPAPAGVFGELLIGGVGLARGYLNQPALTAERFVPDPFGAEPGGRLYRTGDRVRFLPDGELEFGGRLDLQIKLRGFRIEPGEIESALRRHPAVGEAVVLARGDEPGERRLVAYVALRGGPRQALAAVSSDDLRDFLGSSLPAWMLPAEFIVVEAFPVHASGKVDREALARAAGRRLAAARPSASPAEGFEEAIASIWREVLHVEGLGANDPFFERGGNSLLMIQVFGKLRDRLGLAVSMVDLFRYPTIRSLARYLEGADGPLEPAHARGRGDARQSAGRGRREDLRRRRTDSRGRSTESR